MVPRHAVTGFTDGLRSEFLHEGVEINLTVVYLPAVNTEPVREGRRDHLHQAHLNGRAADIDVAAAVVGREAGGEHAAIRLGPHPHGCRAGHPGPGLRPAALRRRDPCLAAQ
jgi:hypothetical protein